MKRQLFTGALLTLGLGLGLAAAAPSADAQVAQTLWPNQQGNTATFESSGSLGTRQQTQTITSTSGGWVYVDGFQGGRWLWMSAQSGKIWVWNGSTQRFTVLLDLGVGLNRTFTAQTDEMACWNGAVYRIASTTHTAVTAAGTFNDCVVVEQSQGGPCADAGTERLVFAPRVGLVEYVEQSIAGPQTWRLIYAKVNGVEHKPAPAAAWGGVQSSIETDKLVATQRRQSGGLVPDTVRARIVIENKGAAAVDYTYFGGQFYDFIIRDQRGNEVYRWSYGRAFVRPIYYRQLQPQDALRYEEAIELRDNAGAPIPAGEYTLEALHTGRGLQSRVITPLTIQER